jgi:hypothetical protein
VTGPRDHIGDASEANDTMKAWVATQGYARAPNGGLGRYATSRCPGSVLW